jgi:hypothetical protein
MYFKTLPGSGRTNEVHDYLLSLQGHALPFSRDVAEEPMFDFVPLARPGRIVAGIEYHSGLVGKLLQFPKPEMRSRAVVPAAVSRNEDSARRSIRLCLIESGSTNASRAFRISGCSHSRRFRPAPGFRGRAPSSSARLISQIPLRTVRSESPAANATATTPPQPKRARLHGSPPTASPLVKLGKDSHILVAEPRHHLLIRHAICQKLINLSKLIR